MGSGAGRGDLTEIGVPEISASHYHQLLERDDAMHRLMYVGLSSAQVGQLNAMTDYGLEQGMRYNREVYCQTS